VEDTLPLARLARLAAAGAAAVLMLLHSTAARAEGPAALPSGATPIQIGLGGGASLHNGGDSFRHGYHERAFVKLTLPGKPLAVRLDLSYQHFGVFFTDAIPSTESLVGGTIDLQFDIRDAGSVRPYLLAGLGGYGVTHPGGRTNGGLGVNGGAGVSLGLGNLGVFGETRLEHVYGRGTSRMIQVVPITVGLSFRPSSPPSERSPASPPVFNPAPAPSATSPFHFGLGGGVSLHSRSTYFEDGYHGRGYVKYRFMDSPVSARLDLAYQHFKAFRRDDSEPEIGVESLFGGALDLQYDLFDLGTARPYVFAGLGAYADRRNGGAADTYPGFNYGGGVSLRLPTFSIFGEIRVDHLWKPFQWDWSRVFPITVGVMF
jgi:hypothetical protein